MGRFSARKGIKGGVFIISKLISSLDLLSFAGEGSGYSSCVYLLYDGIHYDPLAVQSSDNSAVPLQTVFPVDDDMRLAEALEIAAEAKQVRLVRLDRSPSLGSCPQLHTYKFRVDFK